MPPITQNHIWRHIPDFAGATCQLLFISDSVLLNWMLLFPDVLVYVSLHTVVLYIVIFVLHFVTCIFHIILFVIVYNCVLAIF